jgi:hypothetical protein
MVKEINEAIGYPRLAKRLGVTKHAVYNTSRKGRWPAAWAPIIREEAAALIPPRLVPDQYFSFRKGAA